MCVRRRGLTYSSLFGEETQTADALVGSGASLRELGSALKIISLALLGLFFIVWCCKQSVAEVLLS